MQTTDKQIKVGIVGGTGYTGVELLRILATHPNVVLHAITSRTNAGTAVADMFPNLRSRVDISFQTPEDANLNQCDVVFFATPHGVAMNQAQELLDNNVKIIDLAADFRLQDAAEFKKWYGMDHVCTDILAKSVYGLTEINHEQIAQADVIANPGCYPTTVILGLAPLLQANNILISTDNIIADCKSGVSGAGRTASVGTLFSEASDNLKAYGIAGHRHLPEITEKLNAISNADVQLTFIPHLVPMIRGMLSTIYVDIAENALDTDFQAHFENFYKGQSFIDVMPAGTSPETRSVRGSNMLRMSLIRPKKNKLIILVAQDNLVKGASGQAIQNMNIMFGLAQDTGLQQLALLP